MKLILFLWKKISLVYRILIGIFLGLLLGIVFPSLEVISLLGSLFVGVLKSVAPLLVFVLVVSSLANSNSGLGRRFRAVIILYLLSTLLAAVTAVITSTLFPVEISLTHVSQSTTPPKGIEEVLALLLDNIVANPVESIANANYLGVLTWSVLFGLAFKAVGSESTKILLQDVAYSVSKVVGWIINLAPFGILGLVYDTVSKNELTIFISYGRLLLLLVATIVFVALVINPAIVFALLRKNPYPLVIRCIKESGLTAFFTRSSAANIPVNMVLCEKLGLNRDFYSVSLPLGATINMNGASVTITIMSLAAVNTLGIPVDLPTAILLSFVASIGACGASGVTGGSLLLIPMACSLFGIGNEVAMQVVGVGFVIGVVQDSFETALNSSGDVLFAATAEYFNRGKQK